MRKIFYIFIALTSLASCEIDRFNDGYFGSNWQLRSIDTLATGGICDMSNSYIYWAIENHILQVRDIDNGNLKIFFQYEKHGDSLTIYSPLLEINKDERIEIQNDSLLTPLGIRSPLTTYFIEHLGHKYLTLRDDSLRLHFQEY